LEKKLPGETPCPANGGVWIWSMWLHTKVKHRIFAIVAQSV
jgi:hypothetical protein